MGLTEEKTYLLNKFFFTSLKNKRPYIKVKMAISQDQKIAWSNYDSKWISNSKSREHAHKLRFSSQAILTTAKTISKDNPRFTVRKKNRIIKDYISIIFQNNNLLSDFTALENVAIPLIIRNQNYKNSIEKAKKVLAKVNLSHRLNYFPSDLSGGEQQRVAIARSLAADTKIILADEPTGNLDYKTSNEVFSYFLKLKEKNKTILIATHNRELAKKADYTLSLANGNIKRKSK